MPTHGPFLLFCATAILTSSALPPAKGIAICGSTFTADFEELTMAAAADYKVADISLAGWGRREIAIAARGVPVFAWKGETEEEYEWCIEQTIRGPKDWTP